jgi:hypothetical protein
MRTLTKNKIVVEPYSLFYILPYKRDDYDDNKILKKTFIMIYEKVDQILIKLDGNNIVLSGIYEGSTSYYEYEIIFELVNYVNSCDKSENKLMLLGYINQDIHDLFEDIIKEKILPKLVDQLKLEEYKRYI